jgi:hypothetical protein
LEKNIASYGLKFDCSVVVVVAAVVVVVAAVVVVVVDEETLRLNYLTI